jgi:uncharacterized small protein (DUF1192 family)
MNEEQERSKQQLDEKHFEANRLKAEADDKLTSVGELKKKIAETEEEIEVVKSQRA